MMLVFFSLALFLLQNHLKNIESNSFKNREAISSLYCAVIEKKALYRLKGIK